MVRFLALSVARIPFFSSFFASTYFLQAPPYANLESAVTRRLPLHPSVIYHTPSEYAMLPGLFKLYLMFAVNIKYQVSFTYIKGQHCNIFMDMGVFLMF